MFQNKTSIILDHQYCEFGNFCENFIFANSVKRHICHVKYSRLWHDLTTSVKDKRVFVISRGFYFRETPHPRSFAKIKPSRNFPNLQYLTTYHFRKGFYTINNCIDDYGCANIFNTLSGVIQGILTHLSLSSSQIDYSNFTSFDRTFRNYCGESKTSIFWKQQNLSSEFLTRRLKPVSSAIKTS